MYNEVIKYRFDKLDEKMDDLDAKLDCVTVELTKLKVKASLWGVGSGGLAAIIIMLTKVFG